MRNALIEQSSGHGLLDEAALRVADAFEFTPARFEEEVVPVWIEVSITFQPPARELEAPVIEAGTVLRDCEVCPEMVVVPAGEFLMGSSESEKEVLGRAYLAIAADILGYQYGIEEAASLAREHAREYVAALGEQRVMTIAAPFAVGVNEVTFSEWNACVEAGGCGGYEPRDQGWGRGQRPVINVNWQDAQAYVEWLSEETGEQYRLLSEVEWEYAAKAGTTSARYWGGWQSPSRQCQYANGLDDSAASTGGHADRYRATVDCSDGHVETAPVGWYEPNPFGLHDVLGNVSEWTSDCWKDGSLGALAPWRFGDCTLGSGRGGSWDDDALELRSARRNGFLTDDRSNRLGFRVARAIS